MRAPDLRGTSALFHLEAFGKRRPRFMPSDRMTRSSSRALVPLDLPRRRGEEVKFAADSLLEG
jgi:hypothetical protein